MTFSRLNGSAAPLRLIIERTEVSWVENREPQLVHSRRRRMEVPSSTGRESITRDSSFRQNGQFTGRDRVSFTAPGIGQGEVICSRDAQLIEFRRYDSRNDVALWTAKVFDASQLKNSDSPPHPIDSPIRSRTIDVRCRTSACPVSSNR